MNNKKLTLIIISIVVIIGAALAYVAYRSKIDNETAGNTAAPAQQYTPADKAPSAMVEKGKYIEYSEASFTAAKDSRRVLFFHAPWCPQCRALETSIKEGTVPSGMTILKIDYDSSDKLKQKYGVTLQTTLIEVDAEGNLKKKFVAYDEPTLEAVVKGLGD